MKLTRRRALGLSGAAVLTGSALVATVTGDEHEEGNDDHDDSADDKEEDDAEGTNDEPEVGVRVAHLSPDAPNVDVYVDGDAVLEDVPFKAVSDYLDLAAGTYRVTITAAGDPDTVAFDDEVTVEPGDYTVAAIGELTESTFEPLILADDRDPVEDAAKVRLVHASPDAPAVSVSVRGTDLVPFENLSFGEASEYVELPAGEYTLDVAPAEGGDAVASFDVAIEAGEVYTAFAAGYLKPKDAPVKEPFDLVVAVDTEGADGDRKKTSEVGVRAAHMSPDAPNVDVFIDGDAVLEDVPFKAVSDYLDLAAGTYHVTITAAGDPDAVVFDDEVPVEPGDYTVAAIGEIEEGTFGPLVLRDDRDPVEDAAKVRLVHASPDAPAVSVSVRGTDLVPFENLAFGEASEYVELPAGEYTLDVAPAEGGDAVASFDVAIEAGEVYTAFAAGYLKPKDAPVKEPFDLVVAVDTAPHAKH